LVTILALELAQTDKPLPFAGEKSPHLCKGEFPLPRSMEGVGAELISFTTPKTLGRIGTKQQLSP